MSQDSSYPEHAPESFYDRLADRPWNPEEIPGADKEVDVQTIYGNARRMSPDEREKVSGSRTVSAVAEKRLHEEVYGVPFRGPITLNFNQKRHGRNLSELRLSVSNSPHGGLGEDAHRAFRSFPIEAGTYRRKYREMLQEYDDNRKSKRKIQETKNRVQNRIESVEEEIVERAKAHPKVPEKRKKWAKNHQELARVDLADGARLSKIEPSERGRGVTLTAKRLDPEVAMIVFSMLREGHGELVRLIGRLSTALDESGNYQLKEDLFEFFDTGDTTSW